MIDIVYKSSEYNYHLYKTNLITENLLEFKFQSRQGHQKYQKVFGADQKSSTSGYTKYNFFQLTSGSILFYKLYEDIRFVILDYLKDKTDIQYKWFTSWINFHKSDEVLDWHNHIESFCHGYLSIDPKDTTTEFEKYSVKNESGLIYIGPSEVQHKVNVDKPFNGNRITIAFDVVLHDKSKSYRTPHLGYLPLV